MQDFSAILIGDVHLADGPPSSRTEDYTEDILAKVQWIVEEAARLKVDAIVQDGDLFHIKTPTRNSHRLVQRTGEILTSANIPVLITPGNHDISNDRIDSLSRQPLGTLAKFPGIDLLMGPHEEFPLFGIPYLHDWGTELPLWMSKYREWCTSKKIEDIDFWPLMVTHAPIFPPGENPPYDFIASEDWAMMMENGDCVYGHIHDVHGIYKPNPEYPVTMVNNGAISRGSLHEATLKRKPQVTLWEGRMGKYTPIPVPHRPAEAVFRLKEKEDVDERNSRAEEFLREIGTTTLDGLSMEEVGHIARERGLSPRTLTLIEDLIQHVS